MGIMSNMFIYGIVLSFLVFFLFPSYDQNSESLWSKVSGGEYQGDIASLLFSGVTTENLVGGLLVAVGIAVGTIFPNPYTMFLGVAFFFSGLYLLVGNEFAHFVNATGIDSQNPFVLLVSALTPILFLLALLQWHRYGTGDLP